MTFKYRTTAVGGTFDHIHKGHRALLAKAFDTAEHVVIGLTSDKFAASSGKKISHDFETRKHHLENYLKQTYPERDYKVTKLERNFGPGMFTMDIESIIVSEETAYRVDEANTKRRAMGLPDLIVEVVPMIMADDKQRISATRIRAGEIDAEGKLISKRSKH